MKVSGIDHIEFYVGDARQAAFYYCAAFGFQLYGQGGPETGLKGQRSLLLGQGDIRILLTSGLSADHPATEYVRRHGDGVAVVGLEVDDVEASYSLLVDRGADALATPSRHHRDGAEVVTAEVSGFSDVVHRLVERRGPRWEFLPGLINMATTEEPKSPSGGPLLREIDHLAICAPSGALEEMVSYYENVFGFAEIFEEYIEVGEQGMESKVVQSPSKLVTLTILEPDPKRQPGQIDDFLQWHAGAGVQHVAFSTNDIVRAVSTLSEQGVRFASTPASYYETLEARVGELDGALEDLRRLGVLADRDHWGQLLQIFTESMHVRRTLFLEVIERQGARTFGSGNIKALYEAKNRELSGAQ